MAARTDRGAEHAPRPRTNGKFLAVGDEALAVRGVTYGTFRPDGPDGDYPPPPAVDADFRAMAGCGFNAVRVYTVPPRWLLDCAAAHRLRVLVGLPWEQHVAFLDRGRTGGRRARDITERVAEGVRSCAGHPAVLGYAVGNEIPAGVVRWLGRRRVERFLERLIAAAKAADPGALVTYVNYPSTEYLTLPGADFVCFNVYLERQDRLAAYLARLQNLAGDRPLVLAEVGLDSRRNGEDPQAQALDWQLRTALAAGCAGAFVFAWTDEWHRGGHDVDDWDFGLVDRARRSKPALAAVARAFADGPFTPDATWPRMSVVVCTYNGGRTIGDCLDGLREQTYADHEVVVVDDGSTDDTGAVVAARAHEFPALRLVRVPNAGLSAARNVGLRAATGDVVCYTDDDARPDRNWLLYLAAEFHYSDHGAVGGPNIPPRGDGPIAECVANAPGGPIHVLVTDTEAEHVPGCNFAVRRVALAAIGGFDPTFRVAGDDVDVCWRLLERGWTIGFCPAAFVWHHRRNSVRAYWRQQKGYGKAEALLEAKWPEKYNTFGHLSWGGRLYGVRLFEAVQRRRGRVYGGMWGSAPFQSLYAPAPAGAWALATMPEWNLLTGALALLALLALEWRGLVWVLPVFVLAFGVQLTQAVVAARESVFPSEPRGRARIRLVALTAMLHLTQPLARLAGRLGHGLAPWRLARWPGFAWPAPRDTHFWFERWASPQERLAVLEDALRAAGAVPGHGGAFDGWDLVVRAGLLGSARIRVLAEEHGAGRQLVRLGVRPVVRLVPLAMGGLLAVLAALAALDHAWAVAVVLGAAALAVGARALYECAKAVAVVPLAAAAWDAAPVAA